MAADEHGAGDAFVGQDFRERETESAAAKNRKLEIGLQKEMKKIVVIRDYIAHIRGEGDQRRGWAEERENPKRCYCSLKTYARRVSALRVLGDCRRSQW